MSDIVACRGNFLDESFNLIEHPVDAVGKLIERVIAAARGETLTQVACHDVLDSSIDFRKPIVSPRAQNQSGDDRQREGRQQTQSQCPLYNFGNLLDVVDVATDRNNL